MSGHTAEQKPAPDAMREALLKRTVEFIEANDPFGDAFSEHDLKSLMTDKADTASEPCAICGVLVSQVPGEGHHWGQCAICKKWNTRAAAPMPPADSHAELVKALEEIARQHIGDEIEEHISDDGADFEGGYEALVKIARAALDTLTARKVG